MYMIKMNDSELGSNPQQTLLLGRYGLYNPRFPDKKDDPFNCLRSMSVSAKEGGLQDANPENAIVSVHNRLANSVAMPGLSSTKMQS